MTLEAKLAFYHPRHVLSWVRTVASSLPLGHSLGSLVPQLPTYMLSDSFIAILPSLVNFLLSLTSCNKRCGLLCPGLQIAFPTRLNGRILKHQAASSMQATAHVTSGCIHCPFSPFYPINSCPPLTQIFSDVLQDVSLWRLTLERNNLFFHLANCVPCLWLSLNASQPVLPLWGRMRALKAWGL